MDLRLAPETRELARVVREWSVAELRPLARQAEREHRVPDEARAALRRAPFAGDTTSGRFELVNSSGDPKLRDGRYVTATTVMEQGLYGDAMFLPVTETGIGGKVVDLLGTPEQLNRWRSDAAVKKFGVTGFGLTEPGAGSDAAGIRTSAVRMGDQWQLNGNKIFCSNAAVAGYVVVFATVDPAQGSRGIRAFVVEKGTPGFEIVKENESKLGMRAMLTTAFALDDAVIPFENCLGKEADGPATFRTALATLNTTRHQVASMAIGVAQASLDEARELLAPRRSGFTSPRWFRIEAELDSFDAQLHRARLLARRAAGLLDHGLPHATEASAAKVLAPPLAERICARVITMLGSDGYSDEFLFEKRYRDIKIMDIWEGTGQIQRGIIGQHLIKGGGRTMRPSAGRS
jgi:acyl-CoA dehydrogenase